MIKYRHYKGRVYTLICEAHRTDNAVHVDVIYQDESLNFWSRPKGEFFGTVEASPGHHVPRFVQVYRDSQSPI